MARRFIQLILNKNSSFQTMLDELALRLYALCAKIDSRETGCSQKMNNCQLFTFQVRKIAARRKYTKNGRICNENCGTALRQDGLCTLGR